MTRLETRDKRYCKWHAGIAAGLALPAAWIFIKLQPLQCEGHFGSFVPTDDPVGRRFIEASYSWTQPLTWTDFSCLAHLWTVQGLFSMHMCSSLSFPDRNCRHFAEFLSQVPTGWWETQAAVGWCSRDLWNDTPGKMHQDSLAPSLLAFKCQNLFNIRCLKNALHEK